MIIFEGKLSGQALKSCNKKIRKEIAIVLTIISIIVLFIWCSIFGFDLKVLYPVAVLAALFITCILVCNKINTKVFKIIVDPDERTVVYEAKNEKEHFLMFDDIKSVYDYGEYYHFLQGDMFLCQKTLLVRGTLEEFENLFEGKIIRKN